MYLRGLTLGSFKLNHGNRCIHPWVIARLLRLRFEDLNKSIDARNKSSHTLGYTSRCKGLNSFPAQCFGKYIS